MRLFFCFLRQICPFRDKLVLFSSHYYGILDTTLSIEVMSVTVAICDDDALCQEELLTWAKEYIQESPYAGTAVRSFSAPEALLEAVENGTVFDICILDILMPGMDGIQLGVRLRQLGFQGMILYLTTSRDYAVDSFQAKPFNYLLKPLDRETFCPALEEALTVMAQRMDKSILIRTQDAMVKLALNDILYAERRHRAVHYYLTNGSTVESIQIRSSFTDAVQPLLEDGRFALGGATQAVNLHHITAIENETLVFRNGLRVYWGKRACRKLRTLWFEYYLATEDRP